MGEHNGLMFHTIGQRQGLGIGGVANAHQAPWYVAAKNIKENSLVVVQGNDHPLLFATSLTASMPIGLMASRPYHRHQAEHDTVRQTKPVLFWTN